MKRRICMVLLATGALAIAGMVGSMSYGLAQDGSAGGPIRLAEQQKKKAVTKSVPKSTPKTVGTPKQAGGTTSVGRTKTIETKKTVVTKKAVTATKASTATTTTVVRGGGHGGFRAVGVRDRGRIVFRGGNYTVWRGSHRVRFGGGWRTFVALSALPVVVVGGASLYPYAYVSTPEPLCEGTTDDGCVLQWGEVPTLEGTPAVQCVAYCPWQ